MTEMAQHTHVDNLRKKILIIEDPGDFDHSTGDPGWRKEPRPEESQAASSPYRQSTSSGSKCQTSCLLGTGTEGGASEAGMMVSQPPTEAALGKANSLW